VPRIHAEHRAEILRRSLDEGADADDSGNVHGDVDAAERRHDVAEGALDLRQVAYVGAQHLGPAPLLAHPRRDRGRFGIVHVQDRDIRALLR
jgi:hypothetical protein